MELSGRPPMARVGGKHTLRVSYGAAGAADPLWIRCSPESLHGQGTTVLAFLEEASITGDKFCPFITARRSASLRLQRSLATTRTRGG
jgi:hypothetical protein